MRRHSLSLVMIFIGCLCLGQKRGTPLFSDNFDLRGTFIENWRPSSGISNDHGAVRIPHGGFLEMKRPTPDEFHATIRMKISPPKDLKSDQRGFGGLRIAGNVFVIRPDAKGWMVYKVPGQKQAGGAEGTISGFSYNHYHRLTLVRTLVGTSQDSFQYLFYVDDKLIGQTILGRPGKNQELCIFGYREDITFDDFQLSTVNKGGQDSPNMAVNSSFEHLQEGMPIYVDTDTPREYSYQAPYEQYLKTFRIDTEENHSGKQSLRLTFDESCKRQGFQTWDTGMVVGQPMTYSVYLKADRDQLPARLSIWEMRTKWHWQDIKLTPHWKRYVFTLPSASRSAVRVGLRFTTPGTVWADDVQVEIGNEASPYRVSNLDREKFSAPSNAYVQLPPNTAPRLSVVPAMDANLDRWIGQAHEAGPFFFKTGKPQNRSRAWFGCDAENLYVGIRAYVKDRAKHTARKTERDDFQIFAQENIELLVDPGRSKSRYYQLVVSALGCQTDHGFGRDPSWSGDWQAATRFNEKEHAFDYEIRLPFSTFTHNLAHNHWGFNIGRSDTATKEASALMPWQEPNFHLPGGYPILKLPEEIIRPYAAGITQTHVAKSGNGERLVVTGKLENNTEATLAGTLKATVARTGAELAVIPVKLTTGTNDFNLVVHPYDIKNESIRFTLTCGKRRIFAQVHRPTLFSPVTITGKYNYYMKEPKAEFRVKCSLEKPEELTAEVTAAGQTQTVPASAQFTIALPLASIPNGEHAVTLRLFRKTQNVAEITVPLIRKPYQKGAIQINQFRRCLSSEGQNILPFMPLISVWPFTKNPEQLVDFYADYGFKSLMMVISRQAIDTAAKVLAQARRRNMRIIYWNNWQNLKHGQNMTVEKLKAEAHRLAKLDTILGQLVVDEPELSMKSEDTSRLLTKMRAYFPYHPTFMNNTVMGIPNRFADLNTDLLMLDDYLTNKENRTVREIVDQVDIMWRAGAAEHKPCFYFLVGNNMHNHYREPTAAEQVAQTYGSLAANCTGFTYFMGLPSYPEHWKAYLQLNREIIALNDIVLSEEETPEVTVSDATLRHITRKHREAIYVIAANIENQPLKRISFTLPAGRKYADQAEVLFENRKLTVRNGHFTDTFNPLTRHVYKIPFTR